MEKPNKFVLLTVGPRLSTGELVSVDEAVAEAKHMLQHRRASLIPSERCRADHPIYVMGVVAIVEPEVVPQPPVKVTRFDQ